MSFEHITYDERDDIRSAWITINHPERYNAFDHETIKEIRNAVQRAGDNRELGSVVLTGEGDKAFCAGGYAGHLEEQNETKLRRMYRFFGQTVNTIRRIPQPVIAAVNGYAVGGGNELVVACDFAIASDNAKLGQNETKIGSSPVYGGTNMLTIQIGEKKAKEVSMLSRKFPAEEAERMGWINEVVPQGQLYERVEEWCEEILGCSPRYLEISKKSSNYWWDLLQPAYEHGIESVIQAAQSEDMKEGASAFLEKRDPDFNQFRVND